MYKKQISDLTNELKRHERNKSEFLLGFKKLLQIIDNVKKQKVSSILMKALMASITLLIKELKSLCETTN